jgi:hypothetical protein
LVRVGAGCTRSNYQFTAPKQQISPWRPQAKPVVPLQRQNQFSAIDTNKPYAYKPKDLTQPNNVLIDQRALANQRNFMHDNSHNRRMSQSYDHPHPIQGSDMSLASGPPKAFPTEHYYSMRTLPAAVPGEYSTFTQAVRRESQGQQTMQRPGPQLSGYTPAYPPAKAQMTPYHHSPPPPAVMFHRESSGSRPSTSTQGYQSPYAAPLTPATTHSTTSAHKPAESSFSDEEYLANLRNYPYLLRCHLEKAKVYESPYPLGGGFSGKYQMLTQRPAAPPSQRPHSYHTPQNSISGPLEKKESTGWTPPSQIWDKAGLMRLPSPPPQHQVAHMASRRLPAPTYSTAGEWKQQIQSMPSTASREGAQARAMRDQQGYHSHQQYQQRNSFGQTYDTARMWQSPKAPTPSPLSDPNTPGQQAPQANMGWGGPSRTDSAAQPIQRIMPRPIGQGYGPSFAPQMGGGGGGSNVGGHETWRY